MHSLSFRNAQIFLVYIGAVGNIVMFIAVTLLGNTSRKYSSDLDKAQCTDEAFQFSTI